MKLLKDYNFNELFINGVYMEKVKSKRNKAFIFGFVNGILAVLACLATIGLSISNNYVSIYTLSTSLFCLGLNRVGLHLSKIKENFIEYFIFTGLIFVLSILVGFTKYSIYFLITSLFLYSLAVIMTRYFAMKKDRSIQSIVFNILCIVFLFLSSFIFFFPAIYAKHATSVSNSNFIVMIFSLTILCASSKNLLFPYHHELKLNLIRDIIKRSLAYEIILSLLILVVLCSVYFTIVEPSMTSYVDSLWYSFSVITTIGFGDVYVVTTFGRILSVILGISGIVVVALFTSVIVNFYNEMNKRREEKEMHKILEKVEEIENKENKEGKE